MAGFDFSCKNVFMVIVYVVLGYLALRVIQNNCDIGLGGFFKTIEGFVSEDGAPVPGAVMAAEESSNAGPQVVQGLGRTPSTCYPQPTLKAEDLLPREDSAAIQEFNIARPAGEGILEGVNISDIVYTDTYPPILHYFSSGGNNLIGIITYLIMKFFQKYFIGRDLI